MATYGGKTASRWILPALVWIYPDITKWLKLVARNYRMGLAQPVSIFSLVQTSSRKIRNKELAVGVVNRMTDIIGDTKTYFYYGKLRTLVWLSVALNGGRTLRQQPRPSSRAL